MNTTQSPPNPSPSQDSAWPTATVHPRVSRNWMWLLLLPALAGSMSLFFFAYLQRGLPIELEFSDGHGLKPGDSLRYRGIEVGSVRAVRLDEQLACVRVSLSLRPAARDLARVGSRFWIVRPRLDLATGAEGLDTLIGANYLRVLPGNGAPQRHFIGLDQPPFRDLAEPGGLDIVLSAAGKSSLHPGAPVLYRQVEVGVITAVELARNASAVEAQVYIKPAYRSLIRSQTRFWKTSGIQLSAHLTSGLAIGLDSLRSVMAGGITLGVPEIPGEEVAAGQRFVLHEHAKEQWLTWQPMLDLQSDVQQVRPIAAQLTWQVASWKFWHTTRRSGWLIPLPKGLLGPANLLQPPPGAKAGSVLLQFGDVHLVRNEHAPGQSLPGGLVFLSQAHSYPAWPVVRAAQAQEAAFLQLPGQSQPVTLPNGQTLPAQMTLDFPLPLLWHGAPLVAQQDGALLGIAQIDKDHTVTIGLLAGSL